MGSIELSDVEKRVIPDCSCLWNQRITNQALKIINACQNSPDNIQKFFEECEANLKSSDNCRKTYNCQVQSFGGEEFGYIWFFYSNILKTAIKVSVRIDIFDSTIVIGNMDIANKDEGRKLEKHLNTTTSSDIKER